MRKLLPIIAAAAAGLAGCNSAGCLDNGSALPLAGFYSYESLAQISVNTVTVVGADSPTDSLMLKAGSSAHQVYLPFKPEAPEVSWVFKYSQPGISDEQYNDTITFRYATIPYFASLECGAMYSYRVDDVAYTTHLIDSVGIVDPLFTNVELERIRIYFRTATEEPEQ